MIEKRIVVYPKDIQRLTGKSERYGRKLLKEIKAQLGKEDHHYITINEFSEYTGLDKESIIDFLD